jgi:hypothetical protein
MASLNSSDKIRDLVAENAKQNSVYGVTCSGFLRATNGLSTLS